MDKINDLVRSRPSNEVNKLKGLKAVLEVLTTNLIREDGLVYTNSCLTLKEAFEHYISFQPGYTCESVDLNDLHNFKEDLCHPVHGLCVMIVFNPHTLNSFVCLKPNDVDLSSLFDLVFNDVKTVQNRIYMDCDAVKRLINSMDTEYDKQVARILLSATRSRTEIERLGIDPDNIPKLIEDTKAALAEIENTQYAADDILNLRLKAQKTKLEKSIENNEQMCILKKDTWPANVLADMEEDIKNDKQRLSDIQKLLNPTTDREKRLVHQRKRRIAQQLGDENRLKKRKISNQGNLLYYGKYICCIMGNKVIREGGHCF